MAVLEINRNPSAKELKQFGLLLPVFFVVVGFLAVWKFDAPQAAKFLWIAGGVFCALYWLIAPMRRYVFVGWMMAAYPIGWVFSHIILGIVFYLVITPIGLLMRLFGYDPMQRRFDRSATTYWLPRQPVTDVNRYFRQF